jgi:hypothetical protein
VLEKIIIIVVVVVVVAVVVAAAVTVAVVIGAALLPVVQYNFVVFKVKKTFLAKTFVLSNVSEILDRFFNGDVYENVESD